MDHAALILGELREFKRATLDRLEKLEKQIQRDQKAKERREGAFGILTVIASVTLSISVPLLIEVLKKKL